jgi:phosphoglycolate phosphatase
MNRMMKLAPFHPQRLPQAVILDWDNTLVENWDTLVSAMNAALVTFGLPKWNKAQMVANSKMSLRNSFPTIFGPTWESARDVFYDYFYKHHIEGLHALDHAEELLDLLSQHGVRMAICSNKAGPALRREVKHLGWRKYFVDIVGAQDAEKDKPDCAPVRLILRANALMDRTADEIWFVGDTASDMQCALRAGIMPVGIGEDARENPSFMPKLWAADLSELLTGIKESLSSGAALPRVANA